MTKSEALPRRVIELAYRHREGTILTEEVDWLRTWLFESADRRAIYLELGILFASLDWELSVFDADEFQHIVPRTVGQARGGKRTTASLPVTARMPLRKLIWSTALVSLLIYSSFTFISWNLRQSESRSQPQSLEHAVAGVNAIRDQTGPTTASLVRSAEPIVFERGTKYFIFENGVTVALVGPIDARLDAPNKFLLNRGRMSAIVPPQARGFVVETKTARIADLGTEFEVLADDEQETLVQVFDGAVDIRPKTDPAADALPARTNAHEASRIISDKNGQNTRVISAEGSPRKLPRPSSFAENHHAVIGSFRRDFRAFAESNASAKGQEFPDRWQFLWNAHGTIGHPGNYERFTWHAPLHAFIPAAVAPPENLTTPVVGPARFARIHAHGGHPGSGEHESQTYDRFVIASYRIPQAGSYAITKSFICCYDKRSEVPLPENTSGVELFVFVENEAEPRVSVIAPVGGTEKSFNIVLGDLRADATIYVAAGPRHSETNDSFDWDFSFVRLK